MSVPYFDSRNPLCKSPFGAVPTGSEVVFSLYMPKGMPAECFLKLVPACGPEEPLRVHMPLVDGDFRSNIHRCTFTCPNPKVWFYHFELEERTVRHTLTRGFDHRSSLSGGDSWQLTVYDRNMLPPGALCGGVMYQIFPDRFYSSGAPKQDVPPDRTLRSDWGGLPEWRPNDRGKVTNSDYFGGDLAGITQKLDYLAALGVTCVYLNPIFEAHSNHRYDTADYLGVDPLLGDNQDFKALCDAAKKLGMSVILDGVFSHTGSDSVYFNKEGRYSEGGAYRDKNSPYYPWYRFGRWPDEYESWWGFPTLPNIEESRPEYLDFICGKNGVLRHWLELGASGFRLDVADELPDIFLDKLYERVKSFDPDCAVIGEVWEDASTKISYGQRRRFLLGSQMDSVMNYPWKDALLRYMRYGGGEHFYGVIMQIIENYPPPVLSSLMNSLSTHDTVRAITALGGDPVDDHDRYWQSSRQILTEHQYWQGRHLFALASIIQFGLPGIPCVYYGDEAGMCGYKDPFNRVCYPWGEEDAGLVDFIGTLGNLRKNHPVFADGKFVPLTFSDEVCSFLRRKDKTQILFAVNRTWESQTLSLPRGFVGYRQLAIYGEFDGKSLGGMSGVALLAEDS